MKVLNEKLIILLIALLCINSISNLFNIFSLELKKNKKNNLLEEPKEKQKQKLHENTFGKLVKSETTINQPPWKVTRCDQIVIANREMIPDHEDFTKRRKVAITISAYFINVFAKEDPNKILHSLYFSRKFPKFQNGAEGCIRIYGGEYEHSSIICGNSIEEGKNLYDAIMFFYSCNKIKIPLRKERENFKDVIRACGLNSGFTDQKKIRKRIKELENKKKNKKKSLEKVNGYLHLGFGGVPGS
jgi:hypothetical protein